MRAALTASLLAASLAGQHQPLQVARPTVVCEGTYSGHLQGLDADADAIYWSFTTSLVKTDADGQLLASVAVTNHHGDLTVTGERLYCAVNFGLFNDPDERADSWVYEYLASDLSFVARHPVPELVYGAGGITWRDGTLLVVGGLPDGQTINPIHEYTPDLRHLARHDLASGWTRLGIQTAEFDGSRLWFGCYGNPPVTLRADADAHFESRHERTDAAYGIAAIGGERFLLGRWNGQDGVGSAIVAQWDAPSQTFAHIPTYVFRLDNGVTAHRGASLECPQNTLSAFRRAISIGADWIELDVFRTADGELVVIHDRTTSHVAEQDLDVKTTRWEVLRDIDVTSRFRAERRLTTAQCPPAPIPRLEEVLRLVMTQHRTRVSIQPKDESTPDALALIADPGAASWVGFNDGSLAKMILVKQTDPSIPVCWDRPPQSDITADIATAREHGFEELIVRHDGLDAAKIAAIHAAGIEVGAWTVNDIAEMRRLIDLGVDRIYTDDPRRLLALLGER